MTAKTAVPAPAAAAAAAAVRTCSKPFQPAASVADVIATMAAAAQRGDFAAAEAAGAAAPINLALPRDSLRHWRPLSQGAQAAVFVAELCPARLVATLDGTNTLSRGSIVAGIGIGSSADGQLRHAAASGGGDGDEAFLEVAIKKAVIRESADLVRFRQEAALLAQLRHHPHVACLLGARLLPPDYCLVLQLEAGNAASQLHEAGWRPSWASLLRLAAQLASAVAALHAAGYVHRDIKPANVLLNEGCTHARLADLGLAEATAELAGGEGSRQGKPTGGFHKHRMVGTLQYMSPEVLLNSPHSPASDTFALAVLINELAAGMVPYSDCTRDNPLAHTVLEMGYGQHELAAAVAAEGLRPTLREDTPAGVKALLEACWQREPAKRPAAEQVAAQLHLLASEAEAAGAGSSLEGCTAASSLPPAWGQPTSQLPQLEEASDMDMTEVAADGTAGSLGSSSLSGGVCGSPAIVGCLPAWLAVGGNAAGAGATFASAQQSGGSAADASAAIRIGSYLTAGKRDRMEDTVAVLPDAFRAAAPGAPACTALGVFDGHRGLAAAEYLACQLSSHLAARLSGSRCGSELLAAALADADLAFRAEQDAEWSARVARMGATAAGARPAPGATATLLLFYPGPEQKGQQQAQQQGQQQGQQQLMLAVANLGDSRVVLCRDGQAVPLTRDHTAELPDERQRVEAAGGACSVRAGGWRVGEAGLQVTRSVGDADLKGQGVTAEAETVELALGPADSFLIAATDGLWDRLSNEDAVCIVQDTVKHPAMCAQRLVTEALARGSGDNTACLVAFLAGHAGSTAERVYHAGRLKYGGPSARHAAAAQLSADEMRDTY